MGARFSIASSHQPGVNEISEIARDTCRSARALANAIALAYAIKNNVTCPIGVDMFRRATGKKAP
jgi:hypothetical protein